MEGDMDVRTKISSQEILRIDDGEKIPPGKDRNNPKDITVDRSNDEEDFYPRPRNGSTIGDAFHYFLGDGRDWDSSSDLRDDAKTTLKENGISDEAQFISELDLLNQVCTDFCTRYPIYFDKFDLNIKKVLYEDIHKEETQQKDIQWNEVRTVLELLATTIGEDLRPSF
ncbi:MAG: hypothetical protein Q9227_000363 [Pyrenula ochraceoflavens]